MEDGVEFAEGVADEGEGDSGHDPGDPVHVWWDRPGEPPQTDCEYGCADGETGEFVFGADGAALATDEVGDVVVEHAGEGTKADADEDGEEGEGCFFVGEAKVLVDGLEGFGKEVEEGKGDGDHEGNDEDDGFGEKELKGSKETDSAVCTEVWSMVVVEGSKGVDAGFFADVIDLTGEDDRGTRFTDEDHEEADKGDDDGVDIEDPAPEGLVAVLGRKEGDIPVQAGDDV